MTRDYYACRYRLHHAEGYFLWFSDDHDGVWIDQIGRMPRFGTFAALQAYAQQHGIQLAFDDPTAYDLDALSGWLAQPSAATLDCVSLLDAWNLFADVAASAQVPFDSDRQATEKIYDKLFYGNNLPSVTPPGRRYVPLWTDAEIELIRTTLAQGLAVFRRAIRDAAPKG